MSVYALSLPENTYDFVVARFVFQHLREPAKALQSIRRVLKPDGIVCLVDVDDAWLTVYPEPPAFLSFVERAARGQQDRGGDRSVGRKLGAYLHQTGFRKSTLDIMPITSQEIGLQMFLDLTTRFKKEQVLAAEVTEAERKLHEVYTLLDIPEAIGCVGLFYAWGRK